MNTVTTLTGNDLVSVCGGTAGDDSLARDLGQYVGGFYGALVEHPILTNLPIFGGLFANLYAFRAMTQ